MSGMLLKDLKKQVAMDQVLQAYNLCARLKRHGDHLVGPCPLHGGDNPTAFRAHLTRGIWNCFTTCGGGDIVDLICSNCSLPPRFIWVESEKSTGQDLCIRSYYSCYDPTNQR